MRVLLNEDGYQVDTCATIEDAQRLIGAERPDLLVLDVHAGRYGSGWTLLSWLRACAATATLPIILTSTEKDFQRNWHDELYAQGCFAVEKPFRLVDMLATVHAALIDS